MTLDQQLSAAASDDEALAHIVDHFAADSGTIHFVEADGLLHLAAVTFGMPDAVLATIRRIPVGKGMAGLAVERRAPVDACNIQTDTSGDVRPGARATALSGAIVVPIFRGDDVVGALGVANRAERSFSEREIADLMHAARGLAARRPHTA
jgi:signal transduction protein with GAF and PtsI domain